MKRYDNGELIVAARIEKEDWYPHYQSLMEIACFGEKVNSPDELVELFEIQYKEIFGKNYPNSEQLLRWAVLQLDRAFNSSELMDDRHLEDVRAEIWRQYTYYVECPHCSFTNNLGEDCVPSDEEPQECEKCGKSFIGTWSSE